MSEARSIIDEAGALRTEAVATLAGAFGCVIVIHARDVDPREPWPDGWV